MREENLYTPNCIRTFSGLYVNVFEPTIEMICIEDIAHALSMQCRFGGHMHKFFSVAQHSCHCAMNVSKDYVLQALLHDASEAYLIDIPSPVKKGLSNYKEIEDRFMKLIAEKFGFTYPLEPAVKYVDACMLQLEWQWLVINDPAIVNHKYGFECWGNERAKDEFLQMFKKIAK